MRWVRFERGGRPTIGTLEGDEIAVCSGSLFDGPKATGERVELSAVRLLTPTEPTKLIGLWNNFGELAIKQNLATPEEPLYFIKAPNSYLAAGATIRQPESYTGRVVFEGELGIVIGARCSNVSEADAPRYIFGYTCVNDVTAVDILNKDPSFAQWTRAKSFDGFGVFGPAVATDLEPEALRVRAILDGEERQNYPVTDMTMKPRRLVSAISRDMTLEPGDVIACGTSVGVGRMKPGSTIEISIEGIGTLSNRFEA
ncbi:MAG: fumarylacetoacetate hydrolase family protein [Candidatus Eremiobacteraeota bacterium]|nr:fumarylacetoacetate hydrolase family protein [Candidatus Eremiobacteraeota bacterium]MBV8355559.1 fumarylacetoacetate hydrolase family protein [Candidatus Eremiobacteraeota bacterium]